MYTNGEKEDIIKIEKMEYESCINNSLEKIITKKYKDKDNIILHDINPSGKMRNRTIEMSMLMKEFADKFCE